MNSVSAGGAWEYKGLKFFGLSLSGIRTSIAMPELNLCFDVAQGYPFLLNIKKFFITHGHLDHAAGIPYIISQKAMNSHPPPIFYMPKSLVEPMHRIMKEWQAIENHTYRFEFIGLDDNQQIEINPQWSVRAWKTSHRIDSLGYTVFENNKKLKSEYQKLPEKEIAALNKQGIEVNQAQTSPMVTFTGDTKIEFLQAQPYISESKVLFMECTYIDDKRSIETAREWGHLHLDELIPRLPKINCEKISLIHLSSRYTLDYALKVLAAKVPENFKDRIEFFPYR